MIELPIGARVITIRDRPAYWRHIGWVGTLLAYMDDGGVLVDFGERGDLYVPDVSHLAPYLTPAEKEDLLRLLLAIAEVEEDLQRVLAGEQVIETEAMQDLLRLFGEIYERHIGA